MVVAGSDPLPEVEAAGFTQRAGTLMTWWYPDLARLLGEELVEYGWHHRTQLPQGVYQIRVYNRPSLSR